MKRILLLGLLGLAGCATTGGPVSAPTPPPRQELILSGSIDGVDFTGVGIGSAAKNHNIVITSPVDVNYFQLQSCHRSEQYPDFITTGWFNNNHSKQVSYNEADTIEDTGDCIVRFCAFSKTVGAPPAACGMLDFHNPKYVLPGENICNGVNGNFTGTAFCHTQIGLIERIKFPVPVQVAPQITPPANDPLNRVPYWITNQCVGKFIDSQQTLWQYQMPSQECVVIFDEIEKPHRRAKLTVVPYDTPVYYGGSK